MTRRGFTLVELLIAVTLAAILGLGLTQLLVSDSRLVGRQEALMDARQVARATVNVLSVDLRMVTAGGVVAARPESVTVRVPMAFGMACNRSADTMYVALLPADPGRDTTRTRFGVATRVGTGYDFSLGEADTLSVADSTSCSSAGVRILPGGSMLALQRVGPGPPAALDPRALFYLYEEVTYRFAPSTMVPGRWGLWSRTGTEPAVELAAPLDSTSSFAFLLGTDLVAQTSPPANLESIRGLELRVVGESERWPSNERGPRRFALTTRVRFVNREG